MLKIGSNGSVLLHEGKVSCAWILHHSNHSQLKACYLLEQRSSLSSYQSELEGIYRGLKQVLTSQLRPDHITQWCDNKAAVDRSNTGLLYPSIMLYDADAVTMVSGEQTCHRLSTWSIRPVLHWRGDWNYAKRNLTSIGPKSRTAWEDICSGTESTGDGTGDYMVPFQS